MVDLAYESKVLSGKSDKLILMREVLTPLRNHAQHSLEFCKGWSTLLTGQNSCHESLRCFILRGSFDWTAQPLTLCFKILGGMADLAYESKLLQRSSEMLYSEKKF
jgi:hypothetical protein